MGSSFSGRSGRRSPAKPCQNGTRLVLRWKQGKAASMLPPSKPSSWLPTCLLQIWRGKQGLPCKQSNEQVKYTPAIMQHFLGLGVFIPTLGVEIVVVKKILVRRNPLYRQNNGNALDSTLSFHLSLPLTMFTTNDSADSLH